MTCEGNGRDIYPGCRRGLDEQARMNEQRYEYDKEGRVSGKRVDRPEKTNMTEEYKKEKGVDRFIE